MAINDGLAKLKKYYFWFDEKPAYIIALGMSSFELKVSLNDNLTPIALHPYFKLAYIKVAWGRPAEQEAEREAGNPFAKDWQDEAQKILEGVVHIHSFCRYCI